MTIGEKLRNVAKTGTVGAFALAGSLFPNNAEAQQASTGRSDLDAYVNLLNNQNFPSSRMKRISEIVKSDANRTYTISTNEGNKFVVYEKTFYDSEERLTYLLRYVDAGSAPNRGSNGIIDEGDMFELEISDVNGRVYFFSDKCLDETPEIAEFPDEERSRFGTYTDDANEKLFRERLNIADRILRKIILLRNRND